MINIGDTIFQLFSILIPVTFIVPIVLFIRSSKRRDERLKRIEEKVDNFKK
jgi:hypothetical protein